MVGRKHFIHEKVSLWILTFRLAITDAVKEDMWSVAPSVDPKAIYPAKENHPKIIPKEELFQGIKCNLCPHKVKSKIEMYSHVKNSHPQVSWWFKIRGHLACDRNFALWHNSYLKLFALLGLGVLRLQILPYAVLQGELVPRSREGETSWQETRLRLPVMLPFSWQRRCTFLPRIHVSQNFYFKIYKKVAV